MTILRQTNFLPTGFGTMTLSTGVGYSTLSREEQFAVLKSTIPESGVIHWNGGEFYGPPTDLSANLKLLRDYFDKFPEDRAKVCLSIKAGAEFSAGKIGINISPDYVEQKIQLIAGILRNTLPIDLFCLCRIDREAKIEETVEVIKKYVNNGTLRGWCVSECNAQTFKKLHKLYPLDAVEIELSLWEREAVSNGLVAALTEAQVPIIAYSPLGHGFLTGDIKSQSDLKDHRATFDRMSDENIKHNWIVIEELSKIAEKHGVTRSQVALEWLRWKSGSAEFPIIYPIPGTTKVERVVENLTPIPQVRTDLIQVDKFMETFKPKGYRYTKEMEDLCYN